MSTIAKVHHCAGYRLTLDPVRFLVTVGYEKERKDASKNSEFLPDWIFDSEYVMWLLEGPGTIQERALGGEWVKLLLSKRSVA